MYDLVVIGGGAGGLNVALSAAKVGARVALVEKGRVGGEGTLAACVPSKGLVQTARLAFRMREAGSFGLRSGPLQVDFPAVVGHARQIMDELAARDSDEALRETRIDVHRGSAAFEAYDTIRVDGATSLVGQRFVVASGSRPLIPDVPGLAEAGFLDEHKVLLLQKLPDHLIVVGGENTGLEFAQCFARLGSAVTVLSPAPSILPREEPEASDVVAKSLASEGVTLKLGVEITKVETRDGRKVCKYRETLTSDAIGEVVGSEIFVATGRLANVEGINLDAVGVHADPHHGIEVDEFLQTHSTRVFAVGDVLLRHRSADAAQREAAVVFQNAVLRRRKRMDYSRVPRATFVDPEVAAVGITQAQAQSEERAHRVYRVAFDQVDRARIERRTQGFASVVATPSGKILGATVVGQDASMILQEFVLAMEQNLSLRDLAAAVPIYPTYADVARKLADQHRATRLENSYVQTALKLFYGFVPRDSGATVRANEAPAPEAVAGAHGHGH
jgi:pyruvate/2-oxoglutarate dehydrogenase complex dihydrolipoamide dehydrogenase (E3) component